MNNELKVPVECFSRVCGYFRPVSQWHTGKQQEWKDRKAYKLEKGNESIQ